MVTSDMIDMHPEFQIDLNMKTYFFIYCVVLLQKPALSGC